MKPLQMDWNTHDVTSAIENPIRARAGDGELQTDFRRSAHGAADATVFVKSNLERTRGKELADFFESSVSIESARFNKKKLSLRFTDDFIKNRAEHHLSIGNGRLEKYSDRKISVGLCDPNANKALHVGHLRNVALGGAVAALWNAIGATVTRQCVVCDIGRNVAEALAALEAAGADRILADGTAIAPQLGALYAGYVGKAGTANTHVAEADAPIARELARSDDAADDVLDRWRAQDPRIRTLWRTAIDRVCGEQLATLDRLGIRFERTVYESDAIEEAPAIVARLVSLGLAVQDPDGSHVLNTGRPDYAKCPLTRSDGFPTEHLRALVLWHGIIRRLDTSDMFFHAMGSEWRTSTEIRLETLEALEKGGFAVRYRILAHDLVHLDGSTMKSSTGQVILLDDLLDDIEQAVIDLDPDADPADRTLELRAATLAPLLDVPLESSVDVSWGKFRSPEENPGLKIARVLALTRGAPPSSGASDRLRFLVLQCDRLTRMIETSALKADPRLLVRYLVRLADDRLSDPGDDEGDAILRCLMVKACSALGWAG